MSYVNLNRDSVFVDDGNDSKVIIRDLADVPGGRALDVSGWDEAVIRAGHIIKLTTATGEYAPLGISDGAYVSLEQGEEYGGVLKVTVLKAKPAAAKGQYIRSCVTAIMTMGEVNAAASPYPVTSTIKAGLPQIKFLY